MYDTESITWNVVRFRKGVSPAPVVKKCTGGKHNSLGDLGFNVGLDPEGVLTLYTYAGTWHSSLDEIMRGIAPLVYDDSRMLFRDEYDQMWGYEYEGGQCHPLRVDVSWKRA